LRPNKTVDLFLSAGDQRSYILSLEGVRALTPSGMKTGNIIVDLVFRSAKEVTPLDVKELYDVSANSDQAVKLLDSTRTSNLQILELNPSYGAQRLFLFQSFEISEQTRKMPPRNASGEKSRLGRRRDGRRLQSV
jgi:hypothetical protein